MHTCVCMHAYRRLHESNFKKPDMCWPMAGACLIQKFLQHTLKYRAQQFKNYITMVNNEKWQRLQNYSTIKIWSYIQYLSAELSFQMDPSKPVMVAGDLERMHEKISKQDGGITYHCSIINAMVRNDCHCNIVHLL